MKPGFVRCHRCGSEALFTESSRDRQGRICPTCLEDRRRRRRRLVLSSILVGAGVAVMAAALLIASRSSGLS